MPDFIETNRDSFYESEGLDSDNIDDKYKYDENNWHDKYKYTDDDDTPHPRAYQVQEDVGTTVDDSVDDSSVDSFQGVQLGNFPGLSNYQVSFDDNEDISE